MTSGQHRESHIQPGIFELFVICVTALLGTAGLGSGYGGDTMKPKARQRGMLFGRMPMRPAELLKELVSKIPVKAEKEGKESWNEATKKVLCELGKKKGFLVYARSVRLENMRLHEWLLDVVWWSWRNGVQLAVESELGNEQAVLDDFEKLMCIKSPLKLLLVEQGRPSTLRGVEKYLAGFNQHVRGETYLVVDFHGGRHECYQYVVKRDGRQRSGEVKFKKLPRLCGPDESTPIRRGRTRELGSIETSAF